MLCRAVKVFTHTKGVSKELEQYIKAFVVHCYQGRLLLEGEWVDGLSLALRQRAPLGRFARLHLKDGFYTTLFKCVCYVRLK